jgi:hypothetical protein
MLTCIHKYIVAIYPLIGLVVVILCYMQPQWKSRWKRNWGR